MGRPDDGTDVTTFNNVEVFTDLKPQGQWPAYLHGSKDKLIEEMQSKLAKYPGVVLGFSQNIQDNVEEAMSGVKGENSLKLFGDDFDTLSTLSEQILKIMKSVPGVQDAGIFKVGGQPNLLIQIDRAKAARYGLAAQDINNAIQAAVGGAPITQMILGDRRFDLVVRFPLADRDNPDVIRKILLPAPDGNMVPLGEVADVSIRDGAFAIYREGGRRYVPIKFSVRGRDLSSTIRDLQGRLEREVKLPPGMSTRGRENSTACKRTTSPGVYRAGEFDHDSWVALHFVPFVPRCIDCDGGDSIWNDWRRVFTAADPHTVQYFGSGWIYFRSGLEHFGRGRIPPRVRHSQAEMGEEPGLLRGCLEEMRPVVMACMCAALGLLPAAISTASVRRHSSRWPALWWVEWSQRYLRCYLSLLCWHAVCLNYRRRIYRSIDRAGSDEGRVALLGFLVVACVVDVEVELVCLYLGKPDVDLARRP